MRQLYESNGITTEMITEVAKEMNARITLPEFYSELTEKHIMEKEAENKLDLDLKWVPDTKMLFYEDPYQEKISSRVLKILKKKHVILDKTCFYGRSGGQEPDTGTINGCFVSDVERIGNIIVHVLEKINFKEGDNVEAKINMDARRQLMQHHSATHVINGVVRKMLGVHVWQNSAFKSRDKARIDVTHYRALDDDEIDMIEKEANRIIAMRKEIKKSYFPRRDAEKRFGFSIYQGGAIPDQKLRIVEINSTDIEACSGTHCDTTEDIGEILILKAERIQDGAVRIEFAAGPAAQIEKEKQAKIIRESERILNVTGDKLIEATKELFEKWKKTKKKGEKEKLGDVRKSVLEMEKRLLHNVAIEKVDGNIEKLQSISKLMTKENRLIILFGVDKKINVFVSVGEKRKEDASEIVKEICTKLNGKGGGKKNLAQGIGEKKNLDFVISELKKKYQ
jgi:alanyl-tRNA synthetase